MLSEDLGQMCLAREAAICGNVNNAYFPPFQYRSSVVNATLEYILIRCHTRRGAEHLKKMTMAVTDLFGERGEANV
jgi:hypothetical protein